MNKRLKLTLGVPQNLEVQENMKPENDGEKQRCHICDLDSKENIPKVRSFIGQLC